MDVVTPAATSGMTVTVVAVATNFAWAMRATLAWVVTAASKGIVETKATTAVVVTGPTYIAGVTEFMAAGAAAGTNTSSALSKTKHARCGLAWCLRRGWHQHLRLPVRLVRRLLQMRRHMRRLR